jgi:hypothetical protein
LGFSGCLVEPGAVVRGWRPAEKREKRKRSGCRFAFFLTADAFEKHYSYVLIAGYWGLESPADRCEFEKLRRRAAEQAARFIGARAGVPALKGRTES